MASIACSAIASETFLVEGIVDLELFETDSRSRFLARNDGDLSALGRLHLWSAAQVTDRLQIYGRLESETSDALGKWDSETEIDQLALRYANHAEGYVAIEAGKILSPVSTVLPRFLSTQNPLIGQSYSLYGLYPLGVQVTGSVSWFDYRAALVDLPFIDSGFLPTEPGSALRPDVGVGLTPLTGLRFGLFYTGGPYLDDSLSDFLPPGTGWKDFDQRLFGIDFQFSRGYFEASGAAIQADYEVPFQARHTRVTSWVVELKYTWTPRFYGAVRVERFSYPFIQHLGGSEWLAAKVTTHDMEFGMGYRFSPDTQLKLSYRRDWWDVDASQAYFFPDGHSVALQLSHHFDIGLWARRLR